jgi:chaperone modulatory protein CbpM
MTKRDSNAMSGPIFDETTEITIVELCEFCSIQTNLIDELIDEGILEPSGGGSEQRRFPYSSVRRTRTVIHLQRDLGLNLAGAALALELLDRIENLRAQLRRGSA